MQPQDSVTMDPKSELNNLMKTLNEQAHKVLEISKGHVK